jgi:hypothetical protein
MKKRALGLGGPAICGRCRKQTVEFFGERAQDKRPYFQCGHCGNKFTWGRSGGCFRYLIKRYQKLQTRKQQAVG